MRESRAHLIASFNSRTPGGVRLFGLEEVWDMDVVSIHAPREGCDFFPDDSFVAKSEFQFTHPGRGATFTAVTSK